MAVSVSTRDEHNALYLFQPQPVLVRCSLVTLTGRHRPLRTHRLASFTVHMSLRPPGPAITHQMGGIKSQMTKRFDLCGRKKRAIPQRVRITLNDCHLSSLSVERLDLFIDLKWGHL